LVFLRNEIHRVEPREVEWLGARKAQIVSNAGPLFHEAKTFTIEEEGFSRWMGWRGEEAQEQETAWPMEQLKAERQQTHWGEFRRLREENEKLRNENRKFRTFLIALQAKLSSIR